MAGWISLSRDKELLRVCGRCVATACAVMALGGTGGGSIGARRQMYFEVLKTLPVSGGFSVSSIRFAPALPPPSKITLYNNKGYKQEAKD